MPRRFAIAISASSASLVLAADQASKAWAIASLPREQDVTVIPGWLWFRLISNSGATLGLLSGHNWLLIGVSMLVVAAVTLIIVRGHAPGAVGAAGVLAFVVALLLEWRRRRRPGTAAGPLR